MAIVISDTFTDVNGTLLQNHLPEVGLAWERDGGTTNLEIQSDRLVGPASPPGTPRYHNLVPDIGDQIISADCFPTFRAVQLHARLTPPNDFYFLQARSNFLGIFRATEESENLLVSKFLFEPISGPVSFVLEGSTLKGFYKGVEEISVVDSTHESGFAGMLVSNDTAMDNFQVDAIIPCVELTPEPPASWSDALNSLSSDATVTLMIRTVDLSNGQYRTQFITKSVFDIE